MQRCLTKAPALRRAQILPVRQLGNSLGIIDFFTMQLSLERGDEIRRETRSLPATVYNKLTLLFARGKRQPLFVPIRSVQFLAIIDDEEIVFVDSAYRRFIDIAWQQFLRHDREDLGAPINYQSVIYTRRGEEISQRLQNEFFKALAELEKKQPATGSSDAVTPIHRD